jgi:hypothetical protein
MKYKVKRFSFVSDSRDAEKLVPGSKELYDKVIDHARKSLGLKVQVGRRRTNYKTDEERKKDTDRVKSKFEYGPSKRLGLSRTLNIKENFDKLKKDNGAPSDTSKSEVLSSVVDRYPKKLLQSLKTPSGRVTVNSNSVGAPSVPAHEVGHYLSHLKHPKLNEFKDVLKTSTPTNPIGKVANKIGRYITTVATEADASRRGYKLLKSLGANKDQLRSAGKTMIGGLLGYLKGKGI